MGRIYLASRITGDPDYLKKFEKWERFFHSEGWEVINPAAMTQRIGVANDRPTCMRLDIPLLLTCDAAFFFGDWMSSKGALCERAICEVLELDVMEEGNE